MIPTSVVRKSRLRVVTGPAQEENWDSNFGLSAAHICALSRSWLEHIVNLEKQGSNLECFIPPIYLFSPILFHLPGVWATWTRPWKLCVNQPLLTVGTQRADCLSSRKQGRPWVNPFVKWRCHSLIELSSGLLPRGGYCLVGVPGTWSWGAWAEESPCNDYSNLTLIQLSRSFGFSHIRFIFKQGVKLTTGV